MKGAPIGRNRYVELQVKKPKANGPVAKQSPVQKPCEKMTEAIVMDGGNRGQIVEEQAAGNGSPLFFLALPKRAMRSDDGQICGLI